MTSSDRTHRPGLTWTATALAAATLAVPILAAPASAATSPGNTSVDRLAAAGGLKAADLPTWTLQSAGLDDPGADQFTCGNYTSAPTVAGWTAVFSKGKSVLISGNSVMASAKAAESDFKSLGKAKVIACEKKQVLAEMKSQGITSVSIKAVRAKVSGADQSMAYRITMTGTTNGVTIKIDSYAVDFRVGRSELTVMIQNTNSGSPSLSKAESYAKTVARRVRAA